MKNAISMIIQKSDYHNKHNEQLRTLVLSTNVNDYDTGEPIVDGNIRKILTNSNQTIDNLILSKLNGIKVGRNTLLNTFTF
jgi:iron-sulfur cluster repair protein YtfE (RIC family)